MLGRARSRGTSFSHVHSPSSMSSLSREQHAVRRPGRSRSHGRPPAGIIGFRRGCVRGLARRTPAVEVALVVLLVVVAVRLVVVDKHPRRRVAPQPAPQRRPPATTSCFPRSTSAPCGQFPGRVGQAFAGRAAAQAGPILVLLRAALQCLTARPATSSSSSRRSPTPCVHSIADAGPQNQPACRGPSRGAEWRPRRPAWPGGGLVFAVPSFASRRF